MTRYQTVSLLCDESMIGNKPKTGSAASGLKLLERNKARNKALTDELLRRLKEALKWTNS